MTDLTKLYDDWIAKRLAWQTVRREKEEILLKGIVDEIEALWERIALDSKDDIPPTDFDGLMGDIKPIGVEGKFVAFHGATETVFNDGGVKRKPGRPPKVEAAR
jgi:hypothetical protein